VFLISCQIAINQALWLPCIPILIAFLGSRSLVVIISRNLLQPRLKSL
jgi:hypothetical protein